MDALSFLNKLILSDGYLFIAVVLLSTLLTYVLFMIHSAQNSFNKYLSADFISKLNSRKRSSLNEEDKITIVNTVTSEFENIKTYFYFLLLSSLVVFVFNLESSYFIGIFAFFILFLSFSIYKFVLFSESCKRICTVYLY